MQIEEHPFDILGITPRSSKREISKRVEALSIHGDPERVSACRSLVTHPAKRLDAEVSWFPGISPAKTRQIIDTTRQEPNLPMNFEEKLSGVDCLGRFNALAYWLAHDHPILIEAGDKQVYIFPDDPAAQAFEAKVRDAGGWTHRLERASWVAALNGLARSFQDVDTDELTETLNADRSVAGIPQITDITAVENAVSRLGTTTAEFLAERLLRCSQHAEIMNLVVESDTDDGESQASDFISRFVDRYQILAQPTLDRHAERVAARCERVLSIAEGLVAQKHSAGKSRMSAAIKELEERLSDWGARAHAIQLLTKSRGLKDTHSIETAKQVRSMAVKLANEFDLHQEALRITRSLQDVVQDVPELAELLDQDGETLEGIVNAERAGQDNDWELQTRLDFGGEDATRTSAPVCTVDPQHLTRLATIGAKQILDGNATFSEWCSAMTATAGDIIDWIAIRSGIDREELLRQVYVLAVATARNFSPEAEPSQPASESQGATKGPDPGTPDGPNAVGAFIELCRSIRLKCWQNVEANENHLEQNRAVFKAAHADYQRQVSPWLGIICDTYRGDTAVIMKVRNAAAECLSSLAGGFICVNDFDAAHRLSLEALPLVFDDEKLEAEIKSQLEFIASEKQKLARPARPTTRASVPRPPTTPTCGSSAVRPAQKKRWPAWMLAAAMVIGFALLVGIEFLAQHGSGPKYEPAATTPIAGRDETPAQPRNPDRRVDYDTLAKQAGGTPEQQVAEATPNPAIELKRVEPIAILKREEPQPILELQRAPPSNPVPSAEAFHEPVSLPNGADLVPPANSEGLGTLKISNYTGHDAAVKLKTSIGRATVRFVYVRAKSDVTISKVAAGEYVLQFATGRDWDADALGFRQDRAFDAFDKTLSFSERQVENGTVYSEHEITLHAVPNGNIRKKAIPAKEFSDDLGVGGKRR